MPQHTLSKQVRRRRTPRRPDFPQFNQLQGGSLTSLPRNQFLGPMPSRFRTTMKCEIIGSQNYNSAAVSGNAASLYIKGNSPLSAGPAINYPLGTLSAYTANYPSGLSALLGSDPSAGSGALYGKFLVHAASLSVELYPLAANTKPVDVVILPTNIQVASTVGTPQLNEQPFARRFTMPISLTTTARPMTNAITSQRVLGLSSLSTVNTDYVGNYNTGPAQPWYWLVQSSNIDGSTTTYGYFFKATIVYDIELFDLNVLPTSAPT